MFDIENIGKTYRHINDFSYDVSQNMNSLKLYQFQFLITISDTIYATAR